MTKLIATDVLTFQELRAANTARLPLFKNRLGGPAHSQPDGSDWNLAEWTNAVAGEVGEACNLAKKIVRGDYGAAGTPEYMAACRELCRELADVTTYSDIAAMQAERGAGAYSPYSDLGDAVREKFNDVSARVGCNVKL